MGLDKQQQNLDVFRTVAAAERYSVYRLFPAETILITQYYKPGDSVLDLACGAARTTLRLYELGFRVKGVDLSDTLIDLARQRFPYIPFELGSYYDIHESNATYDHVLISFNGIDYAWPEEKRIGALRECRRILKTGGTLIFSSHNIKSFHLSPYYLKRGQLMTKLRNTVTAFRNHAYVSENALHTFFASPTYVIQQTEREGFECLKLIGFRNMQHTLLNTYYSPYIYYAFRKLA